MTERHFSPMDRLLSRVDSALRTLTPGSARAAAVRGGKREGGRWPEGGRLTYTNRATLLVIGAGG